MPKVLDGFDEEATLESIIIPLLVLDCFWLEPRLGFFVLVRSGPTDFRHDGIKGGFVHGIARDCGARFIFFSLILYFHSWILSHFQQPPSDQTATTTFQLAARLVPPSNGCLVIRKKREGGRIVLLSRSFSISLTSPSRANRKSLRPSRPQETSICGCDLT